MAIYKNREVSVIAPTSRPNPPQTIVVQYQDGSHETVTIGQVYFTDEEKKNLVKGNPGAFDDVNTIDDDDLKAVRVGVAPSTDPSYKEQAKTEATSDEAAKIHQKMVDEASKDVKKDESKPAPVSPADKAK